MSSLDLWDVQTAILSGKINVSLQKQLDRYYSMKETTTDGTEKVAVGAFKKDEGKAPIYQGFIKYFPRAIEAVANISKFGHDKYGTWGGWLDVDDGINRYQDAKCRHMIDEAKGEELAQDSQLLHAAHEAWGAMAKLELLLRNEGNTNA
jgi:hypothetical protein